MKELFKSLADFQQEVPVIYKGTKGYGYSYADLPAIFETINPILKKHELGFTQLIQADYINTKVFSTKTGDFIESNIDIPKGVVLKGMNPYQVMGSAITYLRRYALSSALGLVTDVDTDTNSAPSPQLTPIANKTGLPKMATKRPPSKPNSAVQSKAKVATQPKPPVVAQKKHRIVKEGDEMWENAKKGHELGASIKNLQETFDWADGVFEEFKQKVILA